MEIKKTLYGGGNFDFLETYVKNVQVYLVKMSPIRKIERTF